MYLTVPIMLLGWIPLTILMFSFRKPHQAVLISIIGGWLILPQAGMDMPGLPEYTKGTAINFGIMIGTVLFGQAHLADFRWKIHDVPVIVFCLSPMATSLSNELGFYDGMAATYFEIMRWGIPYLAGRIYFWKESELNDLAFALVIGGLLYVPLCLYEVRMSPQLSNIFYGFFPHSFLQHVRYGGYRPIVFLQHGLAVSLWMAITGTISFWLWKSRQLANVFGISIAFITITLMATCILCKSANGWVMLTLGFGAYYLYEKKYARKAFLVLSLMIPAYMILRFSGTLNADTLEDLAAKIFDYERAASLGIRLYQEEVFGLKAMQRPIFGWGGYNRGWPMDPITGEPMVPMIDALWLGIFSSRGLVGLMSFLATMMIGPWMIFKNKKLFQYKSSDISLKIVLFALVIVFFMIDSLVNGMFNPIFVLLTAGLNSWHIHRGSDDALEKAAMQIDTSSTEKRRI